MLTIQVIAYKGAAPPNALVGVFAGETGTIGRGDGNTLVLPDPERQISRTHVRITLENGQYRIDNQGAGLPVLINEQALEPGAQGVLAHADQLQLGPYLMRVALALPQPASASMAAAPPAPTPPPTPAAPSGQSAADPLALFGGSAAPSADPFADLLAPPPAQSSKPATVALLPDDFDPFAPPPPAPTAARSPLSLGSGPGVPSQNLDDLFGLGSEASTSPFAPGHPLAEPIHQPNTARGQDPLAALQAGAVQRAKPATAQRDDAPEINAAFTLPRMVATAPRDDAATNRPAAKIAQPSDSRPQQPERAQPAQRSAAPEPAFRSWEHADKRGEIAGVKRFDVQATAAPAPAGSRSSVSSAATTEASDAEAAATRALLQALLEGAGITDLARPPALTPELMRVFGQLLRIATEGTLQLLIARALTKREVQADATMMASGDNNPLKFSPTVEVALQHLLAPHGRGFMSPTRALQDAYDDLRSHQFGVMAGTQAALGGVLARFDPRRLEGRLTQKTVLDSLLPMNRKGRLWDLFMELYGDISKEAEEDFHALFGREFVKAYNAQIEKLRATKR